MKRDGNNGKEGMNAAESAMLEVNGCHARKLGRLVALVMILFASIVVAAGLTACVDEDDEPYGDDWYLSRISG